MTWKAAVVIETDPSKAWQCGAVSKCGRESSGVQGCDS